MRLAEKQVKIEKRQSELKRLLRKLFEDNAAGLVNDTNYSVMFKAYQNEQAETAERLQAIYAESARKDDYLHNAKKLRESIREYLEIRELTPFILNKLTERIEVGQLEIRNGQRYQELTIVWQFCGDI